MTVDAAIRRSGRFVVRQAAKPAQLALEAGAWLASRALRPGTSVDPPSIFVLRNNDVGDVLVVTPLLAALRRGFPHSRIVAGVGDWAAPVLAHNPHVDGVLAVNAPWFNRFARHSGPLRRLLYVAMAHEARRLRSERFTIGIDVLGSVWGSFLLIRAGIPERLGVRGYAGGHLSTSRWVRYDAHLHVGKAALRFASALGVESLPPTRPQLFLTVEEIGTAQRWWSQRQAGRARKRLIVGPGAGLPDKRWPIDRFAELLRQLDAEDACDILLLAGPEETNLVQTLHAASPAAHMLSAPPALREVFALVATADAMVCNSSMLMHVAAAFSKPSLVLLGPSFPSAAAHDAQWADPEVTTTIGPERHSQRGVATVEEALDSLRGVLRRVA
jgi:ADP-heptose:LPS heptosyltransferase